jgi:hypothetical protein
VFATGHKPLIDDLGSIVAASIDVDAFFNDGIGASSQCLADLVSTRLNLRLLTSCGIHFWNCDVEAGGRTRRTRRIRKGGGGKKKIAVPRRASR